MYSVSPSPWPLSEREHMACRQEGEGSPAPWDSYADVEALQTHWDDVPAQRKETFAQMGFLTRYGVAR
jgi:hypothetical protein